MRISSNGLRDTLIHTLNRSLQRIERIQVEVATGKRILRPSDDPPGAIRILSLRRQIADNEQYQRNLSDGVRWNTATEGALTAVLEDLMQLKEIATRAASDPTAARPEMGCTADAILEELLGESRSMIDERYLFSGFNTHTAPFETSSDVVAEGFTAGAFGEAVDLVNARIVEGSVVVSDLLGGTFVEGVDYSVDYATGRVTILAGGGMTEGAAYLVNYSTEGTSRVDLADGIEGSITRRIGPDHLAEVNMLGDQVFQGDVDLFQLAIDLKNALWKDDAGAVGDLLDSIDGAVRHISETLGVLGTRSERLSTLDLRLESDQVTLEQFLSEVQSTDLASAAVQLQSEQMAYQAALSTAARLMQISMVNYL